MSQAAVQTRRAAMDAARARHAEVPGPTLSPRHTARCLTDGCQRWRQDDVYCRDCARRHGDLRTTRDREAAHLAAINASTARAPERPSLQPYRRVIDGVEFEVTGPLY